MDSELKRFIGRMCKDNEGNLYRIIGFTYGDGRGTALSVLLQPFVQQPCVYLEENWWYVLTSCEEWHKPWTWG